MKQMEDALKRALAKNQTTSDKEKENHVTTTEFILQDLQWNKIELPMNASHIDQRNAQFIYECASLENIPGIENKLTINLQDRKEVEGIRSYWGMVPVKETLTHLMIEPTEPVQRSEDFEVVFPAEFEINVRITRSRAKQEPMASFDIRLSNHNWYKTITLKDVNRKKEKWKVEVWRVK